MNQFISIANEFDEVEGAKGYKIDPYKIYSEYDQQLTSLEGTKVQSVTQHLQSLINNTVGVDSMQTKRLSEVFQAETQLRMESLIFKIDKIYNIKDWHAGEGIRMFR